MKMRKVNWFRLKTSESIQKEIKSIHVKIDSNPKVGQLPRSFLLNRFRGESNRFNSESVQAKEFNQKEREGGSEPIQLNGIDSIWSESIQS